MSIIAWHRQARPRLVSEACPRPMELKPENTGNTLKHGQVQVVHPLTFRPVAIWPIVIWQFGI
jgi:hypothetical protein